MVACARGFSCLRRGFRLSVCSRSLFLFFFLMFRRPRSSPLFPSPPLFRSFTKGSTELPAASRCRPKGRRGQLIRSYLPSTRVSYRQKFQAQGATRLVSTGRSGRLPHAQIGRAHV